MQTNKDSGYLKNSSHIKTLGCFSQCTQTFRRNRKFAESKKFPLQQSVMVKKRSVCKCVHPCSAKSQVSLGPFQASSNNCFAIKPTTCYCAEGLNTSGHKGFVHSSIRQNVGAVARQHKMHFNYSSVFAFNGVKHINCNSLPVCHRAGLLSLVSKPALLPCKSQSLM